MKAKVIYLFRSAEFTTKGLKKHYEYPLSHDKLRRHRATRLLFPGYKGIQYAFIHVQSLNFNGLDCWIGIHVVD